MNPETRYSGSIDKAVGSAKEKMATIIGSEELEFKGKMQQMKGEFKDRLEETKETILEKANDWIDSKRQ